VSESSRKLECDVVETIETQIRTIIAEQALLDVSDVRDESSLEDLGIDSLGLVESIFAIEEAFDISVPFNANNPSESEFDISNVATITAAVKKLIADQKI
jgi:acyl carrier protein